jgi:SAM-dependent methyltransferase
MKQCLLCASRFSTGAWTCPTCGFAPAMAEGIPLFAPDLVGAVLGYDERFFAAHGGDEAERSFWTSARSALIAWALGRYAPHARSFLEIGCGSGGVLAALEAAFPALDLVGAEALVEGLRMAAARLRRTHLMQFDASRIPYAAEFDAVGAFDVIEHIADDNAVLASMATSLRPGGVLVLTVPQHPFLFGPADVYARHQRRYTRPGLVAQVRRLGLTVRDVVRDAAVSTHGGGAAGR